MQEGGRTSGIHASTAAVPGQASESEGSLFTRWLPSTTRLVRMMPAFFAIAVALHSPTAGAAPLPASATVDAQAAGVRIVRRPDLRTAAVPLPIRVGGRAIRRGTAAAPDYQRQWPGSYFETAFSGTAIYLKIGPGDVILHVLVDDQPPVPLIKPKPGLYLLDGLSPGPHRLRVEVVTEGQAGPSSFGGFYPATGTKAMRLRARARQIEFIGDSHTVGYGNTSPSRQCTADQVWATTDTSRGIAGLIARRYGADYQVNAISGRGVVRNYGGFAADTLPMAYPFVLFDKAQRYSDAGWRPQFIVIALGTNDFSTPLKAGERWATRDALHADYEANYVRFIQDLRRRNPQARFVLWATDLADGEIDAEVRKVVDTLRAAGERRIDYVPVRGLAMTGCDHHPSTADDRTIADALSKAIDAGKSE